jgi:outer membrane cobalamin receptor
LAMAKESWVHYISTMGSVSCHTGEPVAENVGDAHRLDCVIERRLTPKTRLHLSLDNVFDERYQSAVGFPFPSRSAYIGIRFDH